jgi:hypothetical protein
MDGYAHRPAGGRCARNAQSLVPHPGELWNTAPCHRDGTRHPSRHKRLWRIRVRMSPPHPIPSLPCPARRCTNFLTGHFHLCSALLCSALLSSLLLNRYLAAIIKNSSALINRFPATAAVRKTPHLHKYSLSLSATHTASTQPTTRRAPAHAVQCAAVHTSRLSK